MKNRQIGEETSLSSSRPLGESVANDCHSAVAAEIPRAAGAPCHAAAKGPYPCSPTVATMGSPSTHVAIDSNEFVRTGRFWRTNDAKLQAKLEGVARWNPLRVDK